MLKNMRYMKAHIPPMIKVASPDTPRKAEPIPVTKKIIKAIRILFIK